MAGIHFDEISDVEIQLKSLIDDHEKWEKNTKTAIKRLRQMAEKLDEHFTYLGMAKKGAALLTVGMVAIAPFTGGASLSLAGLAAGVFAGITYASVEIIERALSMDLIDEANKSFREYNKTIKELRSKNSNIHYRLNVYGSVDDDFPEWVKFWKGELHLESDWKHKYSRFYGRLGHLLVQDAVEMIGGWTDALTQDYPKVCRKLQNEAKIIGKNCPPKDDTKQVLENMISNLRDVVKEQKRKSVEDARTDLMKILRDENDIVEVGMATKYMLSNPELQHIAVHLKGMESKLVLKLHDFKQYFRRYSIRIYVPDNEAKTASTCNEARDDCNQFSEDDMKYYGTIIKRYGEELMSEHSNITNISLSPVRVTNGKIYVEKCIVIYCFKKNIIPDGEPLFPTELKSIPVDVREAYVFYYMDMPGHVPNGYIQHGGCLKIGCSVGVDSGKAGTLGFFANRNGNIGFVISKHLAFSSNDGNVIHPAENDSERYQMLPTLCGHFQRQGISNQMLVDAVFVDIIGNSLPSSFEINCDQGSLNRVGIPPDLSFNKAKEGRPEVGRPLFKCGRTTGLTKGKLQCQESYARFPGSMDFHLLYALRSDSGGEFAKEGDSGASIFQIDGDGNPEIVGLLMGGSPESGCTIAVPIERVLKALNASIATQ